MWLPQWATSHSGSSHPGKWNPSWEPGDERRGGTWWVWIATSEHCPGKAKCCHFMVCEMLLHSSLKCQKSYHKEEEKSHFLVITIVKNQEKTERVNIVPALRESCVHQGAKLAAHSDTVCIMDFKERQFKSFEEESERGIIWPYVIPVVLALWRKMSNLP